MLRKDGAAMKLMIPNPECTTGKWRRPGVTMSYVEWDSIRGEFFSVIRGVAGRAPLTEEGLMVVEWERVPDPPPVTMGFVEAMKECHKNDALQMRRLIWNVVKDGYRWSVNGLVDRYGNLFIANADMLATDWIVEERT